MERRGGRRSWRIVKVVRLRRCRAASAGPQLRLRTSLPKTHFLLLLVLAKQVQKLFVLTLLEVTVLLHAKERQGAHRSLLVMRRVTRIINLGAFRDISRWANITRPDFVRAGEVSRFRRWLSDRRRPPPVTNILSYPKFLPFGAGFTSLMKGRHLFSSKKLAFNAWPMIIQGLCFCHFHLLFVRLESER